MTQPNDSQPTPDFRVLFESAPAPYLVLDLDFVIVAASDAYVRATRTRRADILGKPIFELCAADGVAGLRASLQRVLDTTEADAMPVRRSSIEERYWRPINSPVLDADGKLAHLIHCLDDVTDFVRLQRREAETGARLKAANEALERSIDDAQRFAHLAAHDLQAPLNAISGCVRLLREECEGQLSEQGKTYMGFVLDYTQRAQTLIQDLLAYSRLESRAQAVEVTNLSKAFNEALDPLATRIGQTGAAVSCGDLPVLRVDRTQVSLLLTHLVDNAIKFNRAQRPEVRVAAERRGEEWLFSVRDNGIGIDPRFHAEIFEIFRRLHSAQAYPGSGIGLAICQRIVTRHGGRIWVESQEGEGSTFLFTLPAGDETGG